MKKGLIIFASILFILFLAILLVPIIFKTQIRDAVNKSISESVDAEVVWDPSDFSLSLLRNFPNATAGLSNLNIVNRAPFEGDILFAVENIEVEIDLFSLFGDEIKIKGISLARPMVYLKINENGEANYDIAVAAEPTSADTTASANASVSIDHWEITDGYILYSDATMPMRVELKNVSHEGSGNLESEVFDLTTYTLSDSVSFEFDGTEYVSNKRVEGDVILTISDNYSTYDFKENFLRVNDLNVGIDGRIAMPDDAIDMDLTVSALDNSFKSLLSLVPGIYTENFDEITSEGLLDLTANITGRYDSTRLPAFSLAVKTENAMFQYPDLPEAVKNISLDLEVANSDGVIENTRVSLNQLHLEFGDNPLDARLLLENLRDYKMDAEVKANLNFQEITSIFPMEGMTLRGLADINITAKGVYDSVAQIMPTISGDIAITDGYVQAVDLPYALDQLVLDATVNNPTGRMADFVARIEDFSMMMDGSPFRVQGEIRNLDNYSWNLDATGKLDLAKVAGIMKLENVKMAGLLNADVHTRGDMSALEAERYQDLPTSGNVSLTGFSYQDNALPYNVTISEAAASFNPRNMELQQLNGTIGKSDFAASGTVTNYMGYIFGENQELEGSLDVKSKFLDLNEFMVEDEDAPATMEPDSAASVIPVPKDINFTITTSIAQVDMLNLSLTNAMGNMTLKDETMNLEDLSFNMLGGEFGVQGSYSTKDVESPAYSFGLDIEKVSIAQSFRAFEMVRRFAPIAEKLTGTFSADFSLDGLLNKDMTARLNTVNAEGMLEVMQATLQNSDILTKIAGVTSLNTPSELTFNDVIMAFAIRDGKLQVNPFDFNLGGYKTTIAGATSIDGSIDYKLTMDVPASSLGSSLSGFLTQSGLTQGENETVPVTIGLGGTYRDPKPELQMDEQKQQVKEALQGEAKEQARDLLNNLLEKDSATADSVKQDSSKTDIKEEATKVIQDLFKKKKKTEDDQ